MTEFDRWYHGLDWNGLISRDDSDFLAFCHDHKTACRVAFEAGQATAAAAPQIIGEHLVQCRSCDTRIALPVSSLGVASIRGLAGWRFASDTGWQCPNHHGGVADA